MYSKLLVAGIAVSASAAVGADYIRRDGSHGGGGGGGHGHHGGGGGGGHGHGHGGGGGGIGGSGYSAPSGGYNPPSSGGYNPPSSGYDTPSSGYDAPSSGYDAPSGGYDTPHSGYDEPSGGYGAPSYGGGYEASGYDDGGGFDITLIIIPLLILLGLSLLFPTVTSIGVTGRKKRDVLGGGGKNLGRRLDEKTDRKGKKPFLLPLIQFCRAMLLPKFPDGSDRQLISRCRSRFSCRSSVVSQLCMLWWHPPYSCCYSFTASWAPGLWFRKTQPSVSLSLFLWLCFFRGHSSTETRHIRAQPQTNTKAHVYKMFHRTQGRKSLWHLYCSKCTNCTFPFSFRNVSLSSLW